MTGSAGRYGNFHLGIGMKKIPRYTGISRYLRYHNLQSKMQWKVHYSRTLQTIFYLKNPFKNEIK